MLDWSIHKLKSIRSQKRKSNGEYFQYTFTLFSCDVSFFRFDRSKDYKKVPIAKLDDKPLLGSDVIVETLLQHPFVQDKLEKKWEGSGTNMAEFAESDMSQKWTLFATEELAALLYPNICRSLGDSYRAFEYVETTDSFGTFEKLSIRGLGSLAMYMAASRVKSEFGSYHTVLWHLF